MYKFFFILFFLIGSIAHASDENSCGDTLVKDFEQKVTDRDTAIKLLKELYPEDKGFRPFKEKMLRGPYQGDPSVPDGTYSYYGWYGYGQKKIGGLLYPDGRLVQRGYCK